MPAAAQLLACAACDICFATSEYTSRSVCEHALCSADSLPAHVQHTLRLCNVSVNVRDDENALFLC